PSPQITARLHAALGSVLDVERTAGKVQGWYAGVRDDVTVDTAVRLICCARRLECVAGKALGDQRIDTRLAWLEADAAAALLARLDELERLVECAPETIQLDEPARHAAARVPQV